jgi:hypothetical protein
MPRLNNKDFTVEELERLIYLMNDMIHGTIVGCDDALDVESIKVKEIKELLQGTTLGEIPQEPQQVIWNFNYKVGMYPGSFEQSAMIKNAMRSKEVMENIESRFKKIIYEEMNWYQDRIKVFMIKGDSNVME